MIREEIKNLIEETIKNLQKEGKLLEFKIPEISVWANEYPKNETHGDYSSNIIFQLSKLLNKDLREIAKSLMFGLYNNEPDFSLEFDLIEPEDPISSSGFVNFFLKKEYLQKKLQVVLKQKDKFGNLKIGNDQKINVEFISANPTGPLTLGNGRGGFCGDVLANVLKKAGYDVTREYYINDRGEQIIKLGHSVLGDDQAVYKGDYIKTLKKRLNRGPSSADSIERVGEKAAKIILEKIIKPIIKRMGIKFDVWFSEKDLYDKGAVDNVIKELSEKDFTYESEKAIWFKSKALGDDKDRVLVRTDGIKTYFASDIAYLKDKIKRGFGKIIIFLGADHYGYVARLKAATEAIGFNKENLTAIVMQLVRLVKEGKEVKMSKREGVYITLDELLDEVGLDVVRFFFLTRSPNTHLNFDFGLAKEQSEKNPVYYVQYAYARICSILRKVSSFKFQVSRSKLLGLLNHPSELNLIRQLIRLPEVVEDTAKDFQIQRLPQYAIDLADSFHQFYENCQVIIKDRKLSSARLSLVLATKIVLKSTLDLMGISAPLKM